MKGRISDKKILVLIISLISAVVFFVLNWAIKENFTYIIETSQSIDQCYDAKITNDGDIVVLDSGHSRIVKIDADKNVKELIAPDGYVDNLVVADDGSIWTQESYWDGMWISDEFIVNYKNGNRHEFYHYEYKELSNKHKIFGLSIQGDKVIYAIAESDRVKLITHIAGILTTKYVLYDNAFNSVSDIFIKGIDSYILDKNGDIYVSEFANDNDLTRIYDIKTSGTEMSRVPYKISVDENNNVFFTDIRNQSVQMVDKDTLTSYTIALDTSTVSISLGSNNGHNIYLLSEPDRLRLLEGENYTDITTLNFSGDGGMHRLNSVLTFILFVVSTVVFVISISLVALSRLSNTRLLIAITMVFTILVSGLLMYMLLNKFTDTYAENIHSQLEISAYVVANRISPDDIDSIKGPTDYGSDAYNRINDIMSESYPLDVDFNKNIYCNILTINDYGEPCAISYLDQTIGVYYPLDEVEQDEVKSVYETNSALWNNAKDDISGTYFYVKVPILDDAGSVRGCVAAGIPLEVLTDDITRIRHDMLASSVVILLLLFLVITEVSKILDYKSIYDKDVLNGAPSFPGHRFMILILFVFAAYNMSATFLPIFIIRRLPDINISKSLLASLPITVNIFIIGFMSLFCSKLIKKFGIKRVLTFAAIFSIIGNLIIFLYPSYYGIFAGLILDGIGVGIITNTCYIVITFLKDEVMKLEGFTIYNASCLSGINIGMLLGSVIAVNCDFNYVFIFVIAAWAIVMFAASGLYKCILPILTSGNSERKVVHSGISFAKFISTSKINLFFILMQNPAIIFNSFVYYFLPIYCDNHGFGTTMVSIFFIIYTEIAVLAGGTLLKFLTDKFGNKTMYLGYFTNVLAVLIYGLVDNTMGLIMALCLLGFSGGFLKPALQNYFISIKRVDEYGEDKAMGVYNFTENIGESLGPIVFSQLMAFSPMLISIAPFSAVISGMGLLHMIINKERKKVKA